MYFGFSISIKLAVFIGTFRRSTTTGFVDLLAGGFGVWFEDLLAGGFGVRFEDLLAGGFVVWFEDLLAAFGSASFFTTLFAAALFLGASSSGTASKRVFLLLSDNSCLTCSLDKEYASYSEPIYIYDTYDN